MGLLLEWSIVKTLLLQLGVIAHFLITLWLVVRVIQQQRHQSVAIAWIAVLFALPVVGIVGYMLFGEINIGHQYRKRSLMAQKLLRDFANAQQIDFNEISKNLDTEARQLSNIALLKTGLGVYDHHTLTLMYLCMSRCPWGQGDFKCTQKSRFAVGTVCLTGLF